MDDMHPFLGLELVKEINRDRLAAAQQRRISHLVHTSLFARLSRRSRTVAPASGRQARPARVAAAPMGCTA